MNNYFKYMTKKQKIEAYRRKAIGFECNEHLRGEEYYFILSHQQVEYEDYWKDNYDEWLLLRETILLFCAEIVRLDIEIG